LAPAAYWAPATYFPTGHRSLGPTGVTLLAVPSNGQPGYIFVANTGDLTQAVGATVVSLSRTTAPPEP